MLSPLTKKSVLLFIARSNFSDSEYITVRNHLAGRGYNVFVTSDEAFLCVSDKGRRVKSDIRLANINPGSFSAIILAGGSGISDYRQNEVLFRKIRAFYEQGRLIAAICAAPLLAGLAGVLSGRSAVCHNSVKVELTKYCSVLNDTGVHRDGNILTAADYTFAQLFAQKIDTILNPGK
ncbi:MAG: DJ-1/PfpI family protein [Ignavibacteriaceae bacterium]|nr:DJ-1/PfpI family protein [Ignavibacteriaceae bacterium]